MGGAGDRGAKGGEVNYLLDCLSCLYCCYNKIYRAQYIPLKGELVSQFVIRVPVNEVIICLQYITCDLCDFLPHENSFNLNKHFLKIIGFF